MLTHLRGPRQIADLDLKEIAKLSGIDEAKLKATPELFSEALTAYLVGNVSNDSNTADQTPDK